jgi:hypothetical protein
LKQYEADDEMEKQLGPSKPEEAINWASQAMKQSSSDHMT